MPQVEPFYVYQTATGRILRTGSCPAAALAAQAVAAGETLVAGAADMVAQYHDLAADELAAREVLTAAVTEGAGLSTVSIATTRASLWVRVNGTRYEVTTEAGAAVLELESTVPVTLRVDCDEPQYRLPRLLVAVL